MARARLGEALGSGTRATLLGCRRQARKATYGAPRRQRAPVLASGCPGPGAAGAAPRLPPRAQAPTPPLTFPILRAPQHAPPRAHVHRLALARRWRRLPAIAEESTPGLLSPGACTKRCRPSWTTGCITTDHRCACRQTKAAVGLGDCLEYVPLGAGRDSALTRLVTRPRGAAQLPGVFTQCKGQTQATLGCGTIRLVGRCRGQGLSPPG